MGVRESLKNGSPTCMNLAQLDFDCLLDTLVKDSEGENDTQDRLITDILSPFFSSMQITEWSPKDQDHAKFPSNSTPKPFVCESLENGSPINLTDFPCRIGPQSPALQPNFDSLADTSVRRSGHWRYKNLSVDVNLPVDVRPTKRGSESELAQVDKPPSKRINSPPKRSVDKWSKEEDKRLEEAVKIHGIPNWLLIAKHVGTRTNKMCSQRWRHNLRPELTVANKGKWSKAEDERLRQIVSEFEVKNERTWDLVSKAMGFTRNSIQCRERWVHHLDPSLRRGPWTADEDASLLRLHAQFGNKWKKFTSALPGRSSQHIRRRCGLLNKKRCQ